jgi:DNA-binding transcriptional MerR regulator
MQHERRVAGRRRDDPLPVPALDLTIEQVAEATGMTVRNVRAYQQRGLLPPVRREGRRVTFGHDHVARLRLVRALHDHGLRLRTISDLLERGTADAELARLSRQTLTPGWRQAVRVPLHPENVELFERARPGTLEEMERAGLISRPDGRPHANVAGLGLISALSARGVDLDTGSRLVFLGAEAAHGVSDELAALLSELPEGDERAQLMVQLVATAFADVLTGRAVGPAHDLDDSATA